MGLLDDLNMRPERSKKMHDIAEEVMKAEPQQQSNIPPGLDQISLAIGMAINSEVSKRGSQLDQVVAARLEEEAKDFRTNLDTLVRHHVERITAPLTNESLNQTVKMIGKGMVEAHDTAHWRIRQIVNEETLKMQAEIDLLGKRIALLEIAARGTGDV